MSQPQLLGEIMREMFGTSLLQCEASSDSVSVMTTNEARDYRIAQLVAGIIEDSYEQSSLATPQSLAKAYVHNVLDNGYISSGDDAPVWELVELLGFDRNDYDPFVVHEQIARAIDECDLFND